MKKVLFSFIILLVAFSMVLVVPVSADRGWIDVADKEPVKDYAYSFVVIGDTQIICYNDATKGTNYMDTLYSWIVENKEAKKIEYVFGLGDITDQDWTESGDAEWAVASASIRKLDGVVPYSMVRGNHDREYRFNKAFNDEVYKSQFEGFFNKNSIFDTYRTFSVAGDDYLFITLDHGPSDLKLEWASDIISKYPDHRVIITTHWYTAKDGLPGDVNDYGNAKPIITNHGEQIYNKLVKKHSNIFMVMSGHLNSDGIIVEQRPSPAGNKVTNVLFDTQGMDDMTPVGMISIFYFSEDGKTIDIECFSTARNQYYRDEFQFSIEIPRMFRNKVSTTVPTTTVAATTVADATTVAVTEKSKGCKSVVSISGVGVVCATVATSAVLVKRKERDGN